MNFTFQVGCLLCAGGPSSPKQLIMSSVRCGRSLPKQLVLTMQASAVLLFAISLQVSAATYSQTVSFTGKDVPLKTVFASVKKQTGFGFFYENGEEGTLKGAGNVTVDLKNVPIELFLKACLKDQPFDYTLEGKTIFIKKKDLAPFTSATAAPIPEIKGHVTNRHGEPLVNANITVKRTGHGTVTDANGNFALRNVTSEDFVTVSFIGYRSQVVSLKDRTSLTLVLEITTNDLDKVVVQAYGTTSQRLATGNIGVVRAEDIAKQPVMNVLQALQGEVAGLVISQTSGYANAPLRVEIRGRNSLNGLVTSDPLYIIDGVPLTTLEIGGNTSYAAGSSGFIQNGYPGPAGGPNGQSPFFSVNPSDIESVEVLKDADATAIYGSRAANGVIMITTKKGKAGKSKFSLDIYQGASYVTKRWDMLNTQQYLEMRREAFKNDGIVPDINNAPDLSVWDTTRSTDWQKYLWGGVGKTTDIEASISGGNAQTTFRIGAGYHRQTDILTISGAAQRGSMLLNLGHKSLNQRFSISISSAYTYAQINLVTTPGSVTLPPNAPAVFDSQGKLNFKGWNAIPGVFPFGPLLQPYTTKTNFLTSSLLLNYNLLPGLDIRTTLGYNNAQANQVYLVPIASQDPTFSIPKGLANFGYNNTQTWSIEPQIEYNSFIGKGKINILLGNTFQSTATDGVYSNGYGYTNDALLNSISNAPGQFSSNNYGQYKYAGVFARVNYNFENKYILNLNGRRDGSSRFGPGKQYGNFGSIGGAWIFSEESWLKNKFLSFGKLRGSYGITGGDQVGDYKYLSRWTSVTVPTYNGIAPLVPIQHADSLFQWQVNHKTEIALDLGAFQDKISIEIAWYRNRCNNQLLQFPTPLFTGFPNVVANSPADVENKGWEFLLNTKIFDGKSFKWTARLNIGINRNKLLAYPNLDQSPYADAFVIGKPINLLKLLHSTGVDVKTGLYTFLDKNKDGITSMNPGSTDDRLAYDFGPKFNGGFTNTFSLKNFTLDVICYFIKRRGMNSLIPSGLPGNFLSNAPKAILNRWQKAGDVTNTARFTTLSDMTDYYFQSSDGIFTDASFIRLKTLAFSYTLSEQKLKKIGVQNCKVFIQAQNLFTITSYKGLDPETQNFGSLPPEKICTIGISCTF